MYGHIIKAKTIKCRQLGSKRDLPIEGDEIGIEVWSKNTSVEVSNNDENSCKE